MRRFRQSISGKAGQVLRCEHDSWWVWSKGLGISHRKITTRYYTIPDANPLWMTKDGMKDPTVWCYCYLSVYPNEQDLPALWSSSYVRIPNHATNFVLFRPRKGMSVVVYHLVFLFHANQIDFATIVGYTCSDSCNKGIDYVEEVCAFMSRFVQN